LCGFGLGHFFPLPNLAFPILLELLTRSSLVCYNVG
jgi:hypothetical protein